MGETIPLKPREELYSRGLAAGETQIEAYRAAGYRGDDASACRKAGEIRIKERVAELLESGLSEAEVTPELIIKGLLQEAMNAEATSGNRTKAWEVLAKVRSMLIQVTEDRTQQLTDKQLIDKLVDEVGRGQTKKVRAAIRAALESKLA